MSGIHFAFVIGGKEVDPDNPESPEQQDMMERVMEAVSARMEGVVCEEHHETPRFLCMGDSLDDLSFQIQGCCETLVEQATKRLTE